MTREHKLALILGFSVVLVVGVLISDHFSDATSSQLEDLAASATTETAVAAKPIEQAHANAPIRTSSADSMMPGGFSIDGEQDATASLADQPVFRSSSEALLNEIQRTWSMTQNAMPAAEIDRPIDRVVDPVATRTGPAINPLRTPIASSALPEPVRIIEPASRQAEPESDVPTKAHRVAEDESLWSIAEQYYGDGALYAKLAAFNRDRIGEDDTIHVGVALRIPPKSALTGEKPATRSTVKKPATGASVRTYTVAEGDTLGDIAQKLLGSSKRWPEIVKLNGIDDPDDVHAGTTLKIPASR